MLQDESKFVQLLLQAPKKFKQNDSSYLFQAFFDECEQASRGVHDKEFELTEASEISRPSGSDCFDDDDVCGRNDTEASKLSLSGILNLKFEADEDPVAGNLEILVAFSHLYQNSLVYSWYPSGVLNAPQCTHGIPSVY